MIYQCIHNVISQHTHRQQQISQEHLQWFHYLSIILGLVVQHV